MDEGAAPHVGRRGSSPKERRAARRRLTSHDQGTTPDRPSTTLEEARGRESLSGLLNRPHLPGVGLPILHEHPPGAQGGRAEPARPPDHPPAESPTSPHSCPGMSHGKSLRDCCNTFGVDVLHPPNPPSPRERHRLDQPRHSIPQTTRWYI